MGFINSKSEFFHFSVKELKTLLILFFLLWGFLFVKAIVMGAFHDELLTFFYYVHSGVIFPPEAHLDANNHFLNSVLTRWSFQIFGPSPLAIRLPNVLAYPFFFYAIMQISGRFKQRLIRWMFCLSLVMCGFIFEYFAMCRGYGLSIMFLSLALYQLVKLTEQNSIKYTVFCALFLWLAVASNMTLLIYSFIILSFIFFHSIVHDFKEKKMRLLIKLFVLFCSAISLLVFVNLSFQLRDTGLLVHGSMVSLYEATIKTLFMHVFGYFHFVLATPVYLIFWSAIAYAGYRLIKSKSLKPIFSFEGIFIYLLVGAIVALELMARLMEINYPEDRTAMYLLIFLFGSFSVLLSNAQKRWSWMKFGSLILLAIPLKFVFNFDPAESQNFDAGRHSDRIYNQVAEMEHDFKFPLSISVRGFQQMTWYYSNIRHGSKLGGACHAEFPQLEADIILKEPIDTVPENSLIFTYYDSLYNDPYTGITLFKRKKFLERELVSVVDFPDANASTDEYFNFLKIPADSLKNEALYIGVEMTLDAENIPFRSRLVAAVDQAEEPRNIFYDFVQLDWMKTAYRGKENNVQLGALIPNVAAEAETLAFYLWNPDKTSFSIRNGKCYLYRLKRDF